MVHDETLACLHPVQQELQHQVFDPTIDIGIRNGNKTYLLTYQELEV